MHILLYLFYILFSRETSTQKATLVSARRGRAKSKSSTTLLVIYFEEQKNILTNLENIIHIKITHKKDEWKA